MKRSDILRLDTPLPPNDSPKPRVQMEELNILIEDCKASEFLLTAWEKEFIASIKAQLSRGLTPKQIDRLMIIWTKTTKGTEP